MLTRPTGVSRAGIVPCLPKGRYEASFSKFDF